jgi:hypothetical protein
MHSMYLAPPILLNFIFLTIIGADFGGHAVRGVGLQSLDCWDLGLTPAEGTSINLLCVV